ncbi:MAG TPA: TauD/TfdA family dioxygenase [Pyrinomonadaceae bacterium]|jgi:alpha-ketoglutarate-dependent taurine dioxygenase|nr:TauD/TfdA family dioxygenase [Pyrinomonadaceae bacterium]
MTRDAELLKPGLRKLGATVRKAVRLSEGGLINAAPLREDRSLPLVVRPAVNGVNLLEWAAGSRDFIEGRLLEHGGLLFRGFSLKGADEFERFIEAVSDEVLEYRERSSPRLHVGGKIYTSTEYPADQSIFVHNENSYQSVFPVKIFFHCATAPAEGGETPIADCRRVLARLSPSVRDRFAEKGWMYVRNFGHGFGLPWQTVFQTTDKAEVEAYCRARGIEVEWKEGDRLRTRAVRPAITRHPRTGEPAWFNHATFFHVSTLEPLIRDALLAEFRTEDLPTNTYYGDGSPIEPSVLEELRQLYREETVSFAWEQGDVMMLDNMLTAHGRRPYAGPRKVLVGMSEPFDRAAAVAA